MKIRINKYGMLEMQRAGRWVEQMCARTMALEEDGTHCGLGCGQWCPLFGELEVSANTQACLTICDDRTLAGTIEDLRGKG